jgi:hypothetical protein
MIGVIATRRLPLQEAAGEHRSSGRALTLFVLCLLFLAAPGGSTVEAGRQGDGQRARANTWSARSSSGRTLGGTWTAVADPATGTVTGTWTLVDAKGTPVARGGWSAAKSRTEWTGSWRAAASGSKTEHDGTWSASVDLKPDARFADLFKMAVQRVVSGTWGAGRQSGVWSIRAFE